MVWNSKYMAFSDHLYSRARDTGRAEIGVIKNVVIQKLERISNIKHKLILLRGLLYIPTKFGEGQWEKVEERDVGF